MDKWILFIYSILFLLTGCRYNSAGNSEELLTKGRALVNTDPDSTLALLDSIYFPEDLTKGLFHQYVLLKIQAKDKAYKDIRDDSLIFDVKKYFSEKGDMEYLAFATFYCGRVLQEKKKSQEALSEYLEADEILRDIGNDTLMALIHSQMGYIYYDQLLLKEAETHYRTAEGLFAINGNEKNRALINSYIGNVFLLEGNTDSAMYYYNKGIKIAKDFSLSDIQSRILQNIGLTYQNKKQYREAGQCYQKALDACPNNTNKAQILYNIGYMEALQNNYDSALIYMNNAVRLIPDTTMYFLQANMYKGLSVVYENTGDYPNAIKTIKRYAASLQGAFKENRGKAVYDTQRKYNNERLKNEQNRLKIQQQYIFIVALSIILILIIGICILKHKQRKEKHRREEAEKNILYLQNMANSFNEKENIFRNRLLKHFDILKKAAVLKTIIKEDEFRKEKAFLNKFNEIVYGQKNIDWDMLYEAMSELHGDFFENLRKNCPFLPESEFRICSLIYTGFSNEEIGIIMNLAASSITKKRSSIRKKLGINEYANIRDFLKNEIN